MKLLATAALTLATCLALAGGFAAWSLTGDSDFGTSNRLGGGTITGFRFSVRSGPAGEVPSVRTVFNHDATSSDRLTLYRRYATNAYAVFCDWDQEKSPASEHGGLILPPGDYLFPTSSSDPTAHRDSILLSGDLIDGEDMLLAFQLFGGTNYSVVGTTTGQSVPGFKFNVPTRTDGLALVVDQVIDDAVRTSGDRLRIYRKKDTGAYALYVAWNFRKSPAIPGLVLPAGDYLVESESINSPVKYKYTVLLTGSYQVLD